jgi:NADH dehydrogenase
MQMANRPLKICIVGGGFGGLYTALYLSKLPQVRGQNWEVILFEPREHFLFTPLLYELITGELQRWAIAPSYRQVLKNTKIRFYQEEVKKINFKYKLLYLESGESLDYDCLVLGVGQQNRWSDIPGLANHALAFRTLEDVEMLQARLHQLETREKKNYQVAIVGAGPNGVELACKLSDRLGKSGKVHLIERNEQILKYFSPSVRPPTLRSLNKRGVEIHLNSQVEAITQESLTLYENSQRATLPMDLVIWTAGTEARETTQALDCQRSPSGKIWVHATLQMLDHPEVFALGDMAEIYLQKTPIPTTAQAAYQQASCLSKNIAALLTGKKLQPFNYVHLGDMLTLGVREGLISSFGINLEGRLADIARRFVYILRLPTLPHRSKVLRHWVSNTLLRWRKHLNWSKEGFFSKPSVHPYQK